MSALTPEIQVLGPIEIGFNFLLLGLGFAVLYLFGYASAVRTVDLDYRVKRDLKRIFRRSKISNIEGKENDRRIKHRESFQ